MGFWRALFSIGTAVFGALVGAPVLIAMGGAGLIVEALSDKTPQERAIALEDHGERQEATIRNINDELRELDSKARRDGTLRGPDADRGDDLRSKREAAATERSAATIEAQKQRDNAGLVIPVEITPSTLHVIDAHVGQGLLNEMCRICRRPLLLQKRQATDPSRPLDGYAMSCTGFFEKTPDGQPACTGWFRVDPAKMTLRVNAHQTDFKHSQDQLQAAIAKASDKAILIRRLREHRQQRVAAFQCPHHEEGLLLREKREPISLLDTFYLQCRLCAHTVKLKTAGQLSVVLNQFDGIGLIS